MDDPAPGLGHPVGRRHRGAGGPGPGQEGRIDRATAQQDVGESGGSSRVGVEQAAQHRRHERHERRPAPAAVRGCAPARPHSFDDGGGVEPALDGDRPPGGPGPAHHGEAGDEMDRQAAQPSAVPIAPDGRGDSRTRGGQPGEGQLHALALTGRARGGDDGSDAGRHRHAAGTGAPPVAVEHRRRQEGGQRAAEVGRRRCRVERHDGFARLPERHRRPGRLGRREQHRHGLGLVVRRHRRLPYFLRVIALRVLTPETS